MLKKIRWNHKILGNLELDFRKIDGSAYDTIILAGENGTGKTTILETLAKYLNVESIEPFEFISYYVNGENFTVKPDVANAKIGIHNRTNDANGSVKYINATRGSYFDSISTDENDQRGYGFVYSKARSGFVTKRITSSTTKQLDSDRYEIDEGEDFTPIKQLLVDIASQDASEWKRISFSTDNLSNETRMEFERRAKLTRFETAFNTFFDSIKFKGIDDQDSNEKKIVFTKNNQEISIDDLSTGEKQIVFRGALLLKNTHAIEGGIVLIDEPELSMHPLWQEKILKYYRGLFTNSEGKQSVQMIIATHSEYVLRAALEDPENVLVIVFNSNETGITYRAIKAPDVLPSITAAEVNYLAFGLYTKDFHIQLYGYLQEKQNIHSVKDCDAYIEQSPFYDAHLHEKRSAYGKTVYKTLPTYIRNLIHHPDSTKKFTKDELRCSTELLRRLCK